MALIRDGAQRCTRCERVTNDVRTLGLILDGRLALSARLCKRCRGEIMDDVARAILSAPVDNRA